MKRERRQQDARQKDGATTEALRVAKVQTTHVLQMGRDQRTAFCKQQLNSKLAQGILMEKARAPGAITQPLSPHAKRRAAFPKYMNLAGSDVALATAAQREEVNWWWTCCNTYNPRSPSRHYTEAQLQRPFKIGAEDSRLSGALLAAQPTFGCDGPTGMLAPYPKPPNAFEQPTVRAPTPEEEQGPPPMLSAMYKKKERKPSYAADYPEKASHPHYRSQTSRAAESPKIKAPSEQQSAGLDSGSSSYTFPGSRSAAHRSTSAPPTGSWTSFLPQTHSLKPNSTRDMMTHLRGHRGKPLKNARGMHVTPAMLQPLPGSPVLAPGLYRVPANHANQGGSKRAATADRSATPHSANQQQPPSAAWGFPAKSLVQPRNFPVNADFSQIKPFSRND